MPQKLELKWIGKETPVKAESRILVEDVNLSYKMVSEELIDENIYDNMLIHGDNLLALKTLENKFSGQIKLVYIDPPYNTGNAFTTYDDNVEHSIWLSLMKPRIESIYRLLDEDGTLWISIDDDERDYLKILCDEIFGRSNFVTSVIWQKKFSPQNDAKWLSDNHDYLLVYAKNKEKWRPNLLPRTEASNSRYKNPDNDPRGPWASSDMTARTYSASTDYPITTPSGRVIRPTASRSWIFSKETFEEQLKDNRIWFGKDGNNTPRVKKFLSEVKDGITPLTIWLRDEVGDNQEAKREIKALKTNNPFPTPKPERLLKRIIEIATKKGDIVLDSFLGSGTTAAVAHKMGRKWIGIELTDVAYTDDKPRLDLVIKGEDKGGVSKELNWTSGGGYKFYELAPSLIKSDFLGEPIINPAYNAEMLASAVAIHEGFRFDPDEKIFWKQSKSSENSYLFVTTSFVSVSTIKEIEIQMADDEFLVIACKSFEKAAVSVSNKIKIKKIPQMLLGKCEFDKDNYNLNIINPPMYEDEEEE